MALNPLFYQLLVVALVLLCLLTHVGLPDKPLPLLQLPLESNKRRRTRSKEPKPFPGLIRKPLCEACAQGAEARPQAPGFPPPLIRFTRGRRRTVNTQSHFCPDPDCAYHGWLGRGNIRANGHPGGQPWRQLQCVSCEGYFSETHGTIFHGKHSSPELNVRVIACLAEGLGIRGTARVFEIDPNTVLGWLVEAAEQLHTFSAYFLHELHLNQVQLDELYAVLRAVRDESMVARNKQEKAVHIAHLLDHLWHGRPDAALAYLQTAVYPKNTKQLEALVTYLEKHQAEIIDYGRRQRAGKPIGSGRMEKGVDQVIGARQKHKGMSWSPTGSKALGIAKVVELNQQWEQLWFPQQAAA